MAKSKASGFSAASSRAERRLTRSISDTQTVVDEVNEMVAAYNAREGLEEWYQESLRTGELSQEQVANYRRETLEEMQWQYGQSHSMSFAQVEDIFAQNKLANDQLKMIKRGQGVLF